MKKRYKITSFVLCVAMLLTLCACGRKNTSEATGTNQPGVVDDYSPQNRPAQPTAQKYTLSEYLTTGETIWYLMDADKGKDSEVREIFVLEADGSMYWDGVGYTLGELEKMDDAEIVKMVKQGFIENVSTGFSNRSFAQVSKEEAIQEIWNILQTLAEPNVDSATATVTASTKASIIETIERNVHGSGSSYLVEEMSAHADQIELVTQAVDALANKMVQYSEFKMQDGPFKGFCLDPFFFSAPAQYYVTHSEISGNSELQMRIDYIKSVGLEAELKAVESAAAGLPDLVEEIYNNTVKRIEDAKALVQPGQYRLSIVSDSTGNNTMSMRLHYQYVSDIVTMETITSRITLDVFVPADVGGNTCGTVVYDSVYGGYWTNDDVFYTRAAEGMELNLDQIGKSDLPIDVKDPKSLFN